MRLRTLALSAAVIIAPGAALAQSGGYTPPPVDYASPSPLPASGVSPAVTSSRRTESADRASAQDGSDPQASEDEGRSQRRSRGARRGGGGGRPGGPRVDIGASVEVNQVVSAELSGGDDDVLTYTSVAATVGGQVETRRVSASFGYSYERRIGWNGEAADQDVHSGIAQAQAVLVPDAIVLDAGALATRTGGTGRAFGVNAQDQATQLYSAYVGPSVTGRAGPVTLTASYRLGYAHVDDDSLAGFGSAEGSFDSTVHSLTASAGMAPGDANSPIGWTVGGGYIRENSGDLDNRFENVFVRGDIVVPISPELAATAGVGYARTRASQHDVLRGPNGELLTDTRGNLIANPGAARLSTYDSEGVYYDAGLLYRPSRRSEIQLRAGADQDGNFTVAGSASTQLGRNSGASITVYDQRQSFGQNLINNLRNLPTQFQVNPNPITGALFGGCVFGDTPGQGTCLTPSLQSITNQSFRGRGVNALVSGGRRMWNWGLGATYTRRDYYLPTDLAYATVFAENDQDFSLFASLGRRLGRDANLDFNAFASWYDSNQVGSGTFTAGINATFSKTFLFDRMQFLAGLGLSHVSTDMSDSDVINALIGLRYNF